MATFKHLPTDSLTRPGLALVKGGYRFSYDKCNRLTDAEYSENDSHNVRTIMTSPYRNMTPTAISSICSAVAGSRTDMSAR